MPNLTKLELHGNLSGPDLTALSRGKRFPSMVKRLDLRYVSFSEDDFEGVSTGFYGLLKATSRLKFLALRVAKFKDLNFLTAAELPELKELSLRDIRAGFSLVPITAIPRTSLQALRLKSGWRKLTAIDLLPFTPGSLPGLKLLEINSFECEDWSFLRELSHEALKVLIFEECIFNLDDVAHIAAAIARLPALGELHLSLQEGSMVEDGAEEMMRAVFPGPTLPRLRRLVTYGDWEDDDASLGRLAQLAHKLPALEELSMWGGSFTAAGFDALAAAFCND